MNHVIKYTIWLPILAALGCSSQQQPIKMAMKEVKPVSVQNQGGSRVLEITEAREPYRVNHILQWRTVRDASAGSQPNFDRLNAVRVGMTMDEARSLLGKPWHYGNSYLTEWNYLYRYVFAGRQQQCQYKLVFDKQKRVQGIFWESVGQAVCRH
jgi:hypothetical protein